MTSTTVEYLRNISFFQLSLHKNNDMKNKGQPTPKVVINQEGISSNNKYLKSFKIEWFKKLKWLCSCESTNKGSCFPYCLYDGETVWIRNGFRNVLKKLCENIKTLKNILTMLFCFFIRRTSYFRTPQ